MTDGVVHRGPEGVSWTRLDDDDVRRFHAGVHDRLFDRLGSHPTTVDGVDGTYFAVWAPNAARVSVVGEFNDWNSDAHPMREYGRSGIWEAFLPEAAPGQLYKYRIGSRLQAYEVDKADPFGISHEQAPRTATRIAALAPSWGDHDWMRSRHRAHSLPAPISIYEVHLGSWRRGEEGRHLSYRELARPLADHVRELGFTHVELMPVMEHPFYGSWGYQITGFFSPTSRFGPPEDLAYLIDHLHQSGIGVILDWVPSHFTTDAHGLGYFDGTHLYEHPDPQRGYHPDWSSLIFNYGRPEVRSFLLSNATFWLEKFHADGLRVDAVASMLYLDYSRDDGQWTTNEHGGRENLDAIEFLRQLNESVYARFPDVQMIAEESTAWPLVTRPTTATGLGFGLKWDMGWMHDTLEYMALDPILRKDHHDKLTFRPFYMDSENFVLSLSHDEVVHGKASLLSKMPGDHWQQRANLRLLLAYMYCQPGKKLLFMGVELGQWNEWNHDAQLQWELLQYPEHEGLRRLVSTLNWIYRSEPALHERDCAPGGFEWADWRDRENSVIAFLRHPEQGSSTVLAVFNFTPVPRPGYEIGVPRAGRWQTLLDTDAEAWGGATAEPTIEAEAVVGDKHGHPYHLTLELPPLGALLLRHDGTDEAVVSPVQSEDAAADLTIGSPAPEDLRRDGD